MNIETAIAIAADGEVKIFGGTSGIIQSSLTDCPFIGLATYHLNVISFFPNQAPTSFLDC